MLTSPGAPKASPIRRKLSLTRLSRQHFLPGTICSDDEFRFEIEKELCRTDRREVPGQFAVVLVDGIGLSQLLDHDDLILDIRQRLRITDCLGWCDSKLGMLLPETGHQGAEVVVGKIEEIAVDYRLKIHCTILVYPDDDPVAYRSQQFQFHRNGSGVGMIHPIMDGEQNGRSSHYQLGSANVANMSISRVSFFRCSPATPLWKRTVDIVGALLGLMVLSPVFVVAAIAIRLSGPGPIFFRQLREGKDGVPFYIYKFRTMVVGADENKSALREFSEQDGPAFKIENDPRLTKIGKYLRKSCIDELPQLLNVLIGDMSLVGPRPLPVSESFECLIWQRKRLQVVPGLTCIWQVRGGRNIKFADWMRMDMEYIKRRSFWYDLKLIVQTIGLVLLHRGSV